MMMMMMMMLVGFLVDDNNYYYSYRSFLSFLSVGVYGIFIHLHTWPAGYAMLMLGNTAGLRVKLAGNALIRGRSAQIPCHSII